MMFSGLSFKVFVVDFDTGLLPWSYSKSKARVQVRDVTQGVKHKPGM